MNDLKTLSEPIVSHIDLSIPTLIVMCGIQCSGKSTIAENIKNFINNYDLNRKTVILSSDKIREDFPGINNDKVFTKLYADMNYWLKQGDNVIIDATNITIKSRAQIFNNLKENCYKTCYIVNTSIEDCKKRLILRNNSDYKHKVPMEVLDKYYKSFEIPFYNEGWDIIEIDRKFSELDGAAYLSKIALQAKNFNQHNKHHTQMLDQHMQTVGNYLSNRVRDNKILSTAGYWHDIGKLYTQLYKPNDPNAHYYCHDSVGAYELLCNYTMYEDGKINIKSTLQWLFYINYHMKLHNVATIKSINKWKRIFGESNYNDLKIFMEADTYRPKSV